MAGPSDTTFPSDDLFPGEWPPVAHGSTTVEIADNTTTVELVTFGREDLGPMNRFTIKRGDTWRPLEAILRDAQGAPINLTDADTVKLRMTSDAVTVITGAIDIVADDNGGPETGRVSYQWQRHEDADNPGDLDFAGQFRAEFEIEWDTGAIQTVPNDGYFSITIVNDLAPR